MTVLNRLKRSRLVLRIYLVGLAQIVVVVAGLVVIASSNLPPHPIELLTVEQELVESVSRHLDDVATIERELGGAESEYGLRVMIMDPGGDIIASTVPRDAPPCSLMSGEAAVADPERADERSLRRSDGASAAASTESIGPPLERLICRTLALTFASGELGRIELRRTLPVIPSPLNLPVIALVLVVVGIFSLLQARMLSRQLRRLAQTARALGSGDLKARTGLARTNELGEVAGAFDDMADRVADLLQAEKELVANVSHELRTPLARIRVALDIASEGDAAAVQESLADIAGDLDELEGLVEDVLTAARLDLATPTPRGIPPLRTQRVLISALLIEAAARFRSTHPDRALAVVLHEALPLVEVDPMLLRRAIDNLLENAHKYTVALDSEVTLTLSEENDDAVIEVCDHGIGIAAQDLAGVFRPFFRVDRSRTRATGGLGLGLALAKRIVEAHGGTITLSSEPGEGTVACVRLPLRSV